MTFEEQVAHYKAIRMRLCGPPPKKAVVIPQKKIEAQIEPKPQSSDPRALIIYKCAIEVGVKSIDIFAHSRKPHHIRARKKAMWLLYRELKMSYSAIGRFMNRDHSTIMMAVRSYEKSLAK